MAAENVQHKHEVVTVKTLINGIENEQKYFLPSLQREFVWNTEQIERLFDSLLRRFPIGSFLFWQVQPDKLKAFTFYKFLRDYHELTHRHNEELKGQELDQINYPINAVLDGQQRMNALYIGLKGSYTEKRKHLPKNDPKSYDQKHLYLNLLKVDMPADIQGVAYEFKFLTNEEALQRDEKHFWYKVGDILKSEMESNFGVNSFLLEHNLASNKTANLILSTLYEHINLKETMHYYLVGSADLDSALNIFIRVNNGGKVLKPSDLLFSFVTTKLHDKHDVRNELNDFLSEINDIGDRHKFALDKDTMLKAFLVLSDGNVRFKTASFNKDTINHVNENWDKFLESIRLTVRLIDSFGFSSDHFLSNNSLIPVAYYILQKGNDPKRLKRHGKFAADWERIRHWFIVANISGMFGTGGDGTLSNLRRILKSNTSEGFPLLKMLAPEKFFHMDDEGNPVWRKNVDIESIKKEMIDDILDVKYKDKTSVMALSTIYDLTNLKKIPEKDHIFAQSKFKNIEGVDSIANLQFLDSDLNKKKGNKPLARFLETLTPIAREQYMTHNLIPVGISLEDDHFTEFLSARKELIAKKLRTDLEKILG